MPETRKTVVDFIAEEKYDRYTEILNAAAERYEAAKAARKTERKPRGPLTAEQKIDAKQRAIAKLQAKLDALLAEQPD